MSNVFEGFEEVVRARAYALWESEGRPNGRDAEHWLRSMQEIQRMAQPLKVEALQASAKSQAKAKDSPAPKAKKSSKKH